jgi:hypothetical protein
MDFLNIPYEIFLEYIFCHLTLVDFTNLLCTNREIKEKYDTNDFWRLFYLSIKQKKFREKELKKMRKLIWHEYYHERLFDWQIPEVKKCSLVIENKSDVSYKVSFMSGGNNFYPRPDCSLGEKKNFGFVMPGNKKIITSYVGHMFEIRHEVKPRDDYEKSYKTHHIVLKKEGILPEPYLWKRINGEHKIANNPVVITLKGETYDKSVKEWLGIVHPFYSMKNFKDFKKQHKQLYKTEMKKKDKQLSEKKRVLNLRITDKKNQLKAMSEQFQLEIFDMEYVLKKAEKETLPLDSYFER